MGVGRRKPYLIIGLTLPTLLHFLPLFILNARYFGLIARLSKRGRRQGGKTKCEAKTKL
jgi:hypothetical protein